jgi:hypothetical protein
VLYYKKVIAQPSLQPLQPLAQIPRLSKIQQRLTQSLKLRQCQRIHLGFNVSWEDAQSAGELAQDERSS